jgi:hypothetical protein
MAHNLDKDDLVGTISTSLGEDKILSVPLLYRIHSFHSRRSETMDKISPSIAGGTGPRKVEKSKRCKIQDNQNNILPPHPRPRLPFSDTFDPTSPAFPPKKEERNSQDVEKSRGISPLKGNQSPSSPTSISAPTKATWSEPAKNSPTPLYHHISHNHHPTPLGSRRHQKLPKNTSLPSGNTIPSPSSLTYPSSFTIPPPPPALPTPSICK